MIDLFKRRMVELLVYSETTSVRAALILNALWWTVLLLLPGNTFERPVYRYMGAIASEDAWASLFTAYAVMATHRLVSEKDSPTMALVVNVVGCLLFGSTCTAIWCSVPYPVPAGLAPDITMALASFWVLMRTGLNGVPGWRHD